MKLLLVHVALAACGRQRSIDALARDDWETSTQVPKPPFGQHYVQLAEKRAKLFRKKLLWPLATMFSAAAVAWFAKNYFALFHFSGAQLNSASAFLAAWAGLARLGWEGQSNNGKTAVERADGYVFHALAWLALNLGVAGNL